MSETLVFFYMLGALLVGCRTAEALPWFCAVIAGIVWPVFVAFDFFTTGEGRIVK